MNKGEVPGTVAINTSDTMIPDCSLLGAALVVLHIFNHQLAGRGIKLQ